VADPVPLLGEVLLQVLDSRAALVGVDLGASGLELLVNEGVVREVTLAVDVQACRMWVRLRWKSWGATNSKASVALPMTMRRVSSVDAGRTLAS
jgi:hypothetical protein